MLSLEITSLREFTRHLFTHNTFDAFQVLEISISSFADFSIDGHTNPEFFGDSEDSILPFCRWDRLRPICYGIIRGKLMPLSFRIILLVSAEEAASMYNTPELASYGADRTFSLRFDYRDHKVMVTTGCLDRFSESVGFSPDELKTRKEAQSLFDKSAAVWLENHGIDFQIR